MSFKDGSDSGRVDDRSGTRAVHNRKLRKQNTIPINTETLKILFYLGYSYYSILNPTKLLHFLDFYSQPLMRKSLSVGIPNQDQNGGFVRLSFLKTPSQMDLALSCYKNWISPDVVLITMPMLIMMILRMIINMSFKANCKNTQN